MIENKASFRYQRVYEEYKGQIIDGTLRPGDMLPPENRIAQEYSIDRSTARKGIKMLVDEGLIEKIPGKGSFVLTRQSERNTSDIVPASLTKNIGFLLPSGNAITKPFYANLFCVLQEELKRFNFTLIYSTFDDDDDLNSLISNYGLVGIIFASNISGKHIQTAVSNHIPCTLVNSFDPRIPSILSDNINGAYLAGKYLASCGHKNVLILAGVPSYICSTERVDGFLRAYREAGIEVPSSNILPTDSWEQEAGMLATRSYLSSHEKIPTAIFGLNDRLAFGAIQALHQAGLCVPENVSVMGYDNLNAQMSAIMLTSIEAHVEYIAEATAQAQIWQQYGGKCTPQRINIPTELVIGETVRINK